MNDTRTSRSESPSPRIARATLSLAAAGLILAILLFGAGMFFWFGGGGTRAAVGGPFALEDGAGQTVTDRSFRGKYMLVYFGYTYCPDVCPTTLGEVAGALDRLGAKADHVAPLFITVDPQRDTPAVLKHYTAAFSPRIIGLTGSPEAIGKVEREYHVYAAKHVTGPGPNDYAMDHSSFLYLMGPDGSFIAPLDAEQPAPQLAAQLSKLMS